MLQGLDWHDLRCNIFGRFGEGFASVFCDDNDVFDANAAPVREVDAGFDGDDHVFLEGGIGGACGETGHFVDVEAHAMAESVAEVVAVAV